MAAVVVCWIWASTASATETRASTVWVNSISRRRSSASATTPPPNANTTMGTTRNAPSIPRASGDPLSRYSCQTTATCYIWEPVSEMACPASRSRKSRERSATNRASAGGAVTGRAGIGSLIGGPGVDGAVQVGETQLARPCPGQGVRPDADHLRGSARQPRRQPLQRLARPDGEHGPLAHLVRRSPEGHVRIEPRRLQLPWGRVLPLQHQAVRPLFVDLRPSGERSLGLHVRDDVRRVLPMQQIPAPLPRQRLAALELRRLVQQRSRVAAQVASPRHSEPRLSRPDLFDQGPHVLIGEKNPELSRRHGGAISHTTATR